MALRLSRQHRDAMLEWAFDAVGDECCGLLYGREDTIIAIEQCANVAADPAQHFEIDPAALIAAHKRARAGGPPLIGYIHSHPNGLAGPSPTDVQQASDDGRYWLIVTDGKLSAWRPTATDGVVDGFEQVSLIVEG
jgi:desampylase